MNIEDRKDSLVSITDEDVKSSEAKVTEGGDAKGSTDEDYHNAAALAHRPAAH